MIFSSRRALILDLDFTLIHLSFIPDSIEVPGRTRSAYIAPQTVDVLRELQLKFDMILATARSLDGTDWVVNGLQSRGVEVAALVLEDGARLGAPGALRAFDADFDVAKWRTRLEKSSDGGFQAEWQFDFENCLVARCEDGEAGEKMLQNWLRDWSKAGENARFFRDGRKVYALSARANKWSALQKLLGENATQAAGVGDGENDLVWLPRVATPATFARAKPVLVEAIRARGGWICESDGHDGIAQILRSFL